MLRSADDVMQSGYLSFIQDGATTREDVLLKLGVPSASFENGRILTYALRLDDQEQLHVVAVQRGSTPATGWRPGVYSLVLVFSPDGTLDKHSFVVAR